MDLLITLMVQNVKAIVIIIALIIILLLIHNVHHAQMLTVYPVMKLINVGLAILSTHYKIRRAFQNAPLHTFIMSLIKSVIVALLHAFHAPISLSVMNATQALFIPNKIIRVIILALMDSFDSN